MLNDGESLYCKYCKHKEGNYCKLHEIELPQHKGCEFGEYKS